MIAVFWGACGDGNGIGPESLRFSLSGAITIELETPLHLDPATLIAAGTLLQRLEWQSSGAWSLYERISYREARWRRDPDTEPGSALRLGVRGGYPRTE